MVDQHDDDEVDEAIYAYQPLKFPFPIRLLKVTPTSDGDFSYELVHTTIEHGPPFQSVSYAWGNSVRDHRLTLHNGSQLAITKNLSEAIPHLSPLADSGYLWIDQLCIHQENFLERNIQVKNMGSVYTSCTNCLIWLGETEDLDPKTKELFDLAASDVSNAEAQRRIPSLDIPSSQIAWERILRILHRPWFSRAWVIQEAILPEIGFAIFGSNLVTIKGLCRGLTYFLEVYTDRITNPNWGIHSLYDAWTHKELHDVLIPFHEILTMLNEECKASDSHDLVYAFLGLKEEESIEISPNYADTVGDTYIDAAAAMIRGTNQLDIFRTLCRHGQHDLVSVSSWAPDWRSEAKRWMLYETQHIMSPPLKPNACKSRKHQWKNLDSRKQLSVKGKVIDIIKWEAGPPFRDYTLANQNLDLCTYLDLDAKFAKIKEFLEPHNKGITRLRLLRTMIANAFYEKHPGVEVIHFPGLDLGDHDAMLEAYDNFNTSKPPPFEDPVTLQQAYMKALQCMCRVADNRSIFVSKSGKLCLAGFAQEGDLVCVLHGSFAPVILREHEKDRYIVLEDCYFEDAMYGEAVWWSEEEADEFILV